MDDEEVEDVTSSAFQEEHVASKYQADADERFGTTSSHRRNKWLFLFLGILLLIAIVLGITLPLVLRDGDSDSLDHSSATDDGSPSAPSLEGEETMMQPIKEGSLTIPREGEESSRTTMTVQILYSTLITSPSTIFYYVDTQDDDIPVGSTLYLTRDSEPTLESVSSTTRRYLQQEQSASFIEIEEPLPFQLPSWFYPGDFQGILLVENGLTADESTATSGSLDQVFDEDRNVNSPLTSTPTPVPTSPAPTISMISAPPTPTDENIFDRPNITTSESPSLAPTTHPPENTIFPSDMPSLIPTTNHSSDTGSPTRITLAPTIIPDTVECNGMITNCDLRFNELMFAGLHNAMATVEDGFLFGANHDLSLEKALESGYKALNLDICHCNGVYEFCHGICGFGARDPLQVFENLNMFLDSHPNDVILLVLEINNRADEDVDLDVFYERGIEPVDGLVSKIYEHPDAETEWPTLLDMIARNERMVIFHYNGPDCQEVSCPPGLDHSWFQYGSETEYDFESAAEMQEYERSCPVDRGPQGADFFGINAFVTAGIGLPSKSEAEVANEFSFLLERTQECTQRNGLSVVNVVWVDFWSIGDLVQLTQQLNSEYAMQKAVESTISSTPSVNPSQSPTSTVDRILSLVIPAAESVGTDRNVFFDPVSPQALSVEWLVANDLLNFYDDRKIVHRWVLGVIFYSLGGERWNENGGWLSDQDECLWIAPTVDGSSPCNEDRIFSKLELHGNNIEGTIPFEIAILGESLERIVIPGSSGEVGVLGTIPSQIGLLTRLTLLNLQDNQLTGTLPSELGNAQQLQQLYLDGNQLEGTIPASLSELTLLVQATFHNNNRITGAVDPEICDLMFDNQLTAITVDLENVLCECCLPNL